MSNRRSFQLIAAAISLSAVGPGCGSNVRSTNPDAATAQTAKATAATNAPPALALPAKVDRLVDLVPKDAEIVVHIQSEGFLSAGLDGKAPALSRQTMAAALSEASGLPTSFTGELLSSLEEAVFFSRMSTQRESERNPLASSCIGGRFQSEQRFDALIEQLSGKRQADGRFESTRNGMNMNGAWIAASRVAIMCTTPAVFEESLRVAKGSEPSFRTSNRFRADVERETWASVDLHQITQGNKPGLEAGSHLFAALPKNAPTNFDLSFVGRGDGYPKLAELIRATNHAALAQFPQGATAIFGLSLERVKGKTIADVALEIERIGGRGAAETMQRVLSDLGTDLKTLDPVLGNEISVAVYADPKFPSKPADIMKNKGLLLALPTADDAAAKKVWPSVLSALKKKAKKGTTFAVESMSVDLGNGNQLHVERKKGVILLSAGEKKFASELRAKFGDPKESLAANPDFEAARDAAKPAHLMGYVNTLNLLQMAGGDINENILGLAQAKPELTTLTLLPMDRGLDVNLHGHVSTMGVASALAIYGVNRYLKSAKTSEAKNMLARISRGAVMAYERESETGGHALCKSAIAVPPIVPAAKKYMPSNDEGRDFQMGDLQTGWRCLRISVDSPIYYQYDYRVGGNYKGPARGGPDPGPNGFEVSAEGDLDGDGKTSLFTLVGQIQDGFVRRSTQIFIADEYE